MRYVDVKQVDNLIDEFQNKYKKREIDLKNFFGINHNYENCIIIPDDINVNLEKAYNNILICNGNKNKVNEIINEIIQNAQNIINNDSLKKSLNNLKISKLIFQEIFLNEIDAMDSLFILQTIRAFETYKLNNIVPICAFVEFDRLSDRYTISVYLCGNDKEKIKKIFDEVL